MRVDVKFRHIDPSDELTTYVTERIGKLEKFEMKPVRVEVTFSAEKSARCVDMHLRGDHLEIHSHGEGDSFFEGVDLAMEKLSRQLAKKKAQVQKHKTKVS